MSCFCFLVSSVISFPISELGIWDQCPLQWTTAISWGSCRVTTGWTSLTRPGAWYSTFQGLLSLLFQLQIQSVPFCFLLKSFGDEGGSFPSRNRVAPNLVNKSLAIKGMGQSGTNRTECKNNWPLAFHKEAPENCVLVSFLTTPLHIPYD